MKITKAINAFVFWVHCTLNTFDVVYFVCVYVYKNQKSHISKYYLIILEHFLKLIQKGLSIDSTTHLEEEMRTEVPTECWLNTIYPKLLSLYTNARGKCEPGNNHKVGGFRDKRVCCFSRSEIKQGGVFSSLNIGWIEGFQGGSAWYSKTLHRNWISCACNACIATHTQVMLTHHPQ